MLGALQRIKIVRIVVDYLGLIGSAHGGPLNVILCKEQ